MGISQKRSFKLRSQLFTSSGTFTTPAGVTEVFITGCAGGGGGFQSDVNSGSGGGGAGESLFKKELTVTPNTDYTVTIGAGGTPSVAGGNSVFGALLTLTGGGAGASETGGAYGGSGSGGDGAGSNATSNYGSGQGGSSMFGVGGINSSVSSNSSGGHGGIYGGGGAGGGWHTASVLAGSGGAGFILVEWNDPN